MINEKPVGLTVALMCLSRRVPCVVVTRDGQKSTSGGHILPIWVACCLRQFEQLGIPVFYAGEDQPKPWKKACEELIGMIEKKIEGGKDNV